MSKKFRALTLVAALTLLPVQPLAAKTVAGTKCPKLGATSLSLGKKFTCIKSANKLIWNKGVATKTPTPMATPKPNPLPSPSTSPTTEAEVLPEWQVKQLQVVAKLQSLKPSAIQKLKFVLSPNANKESAAKLESSYQEPITLLSNLYVNPNPVTFLVMNENDYDWWVAQVKLLNSKQASDWWNGSHCKVTELVHCGYGSSPNDDGSFHFGQLLGSKFTWNVNDYVIAYHESIHVYQLGLMGNRMQALPPWFAEGQANYLGAAFVHRFKNSSLIRKDQIRDLNYKNPVARSYTLAQWSEFLARIDSDYEFTFSNGFGYSVGNLLVENLYNQFDQSDIHNWLLQIKSGENYKDAFQKVFKLNYQTWLTEDAAKYLDSQV